MNLPPYEGNIYETKEKALEHLDMIKDAFEETFNIKVKYTKNNTLAGLVDLNLDFMLELTSLMNWFG